MNIIAMLQQRFDAALSELMPDAQARRRFVEMIKPTQDPRHGDYQSNCAMPLSKELAQPARAVAEQVIKRLDVDDMLAPPQIAGPGFINLTLRTDWLARQIKAMAPDERLGVSLDPAVKTYVIDYSSPNVAKPLHVGHLRSTIIGHALKCILQFLGHRVIGDNHLGDWGTQFGMLLYGYKKFRDEAALAADPVREMVRIYQEVRRLTKESDEAPDAPLGPEEQAILQACRDETAKLQAGDPENLALWKQFMPWCMGAIEPIYRRLGVSFDAQHGESFYNAMMPSVVDDVLAKGLARHSKGAVAIFLEGAPDPIPDPLPDELKNDSLYTPVLIRKRDGAFTYMTSDLATLRFRVKEWNPHAILYVVGAPQAFHLQRLFDAARRWGYDKVELQHVAFGSVLGKDRKMLSTRNGGATELSELLDMAVARGAEKYEQTRQDRLARGDDVPDLTSEEQRAIAECVGLGAVRYADLMQNRLSDYVFDWNKMLSTDGNTATYMQYAYVRNLGIFRRGNIDVEAVRRAAEVPALGTSQERALAHQLIRFEDVVRAAAAEYAPHLLTAYLWDLARCYSSFFDACPVLKAESDDLRQDRLLLCDLTARVIRRTLGLLGISTVERM